MDYGRDILFFKEKIWKRVYEVSTIGHEFGHIFFIAKDSEKLMNQSGFLKISKNIRQQVADLLISFIMNKRI